MRTENKVFQAYFKAKKPQLYFNELKELTGLSDSSLSNTLKKLVKLEYVISLKTKSNTYYRIKNKKLFGLKFAEIAQSQFESLNRGVKNPLKEFLLRTEFELCTIVLFGSASQKKEKKGSDIDLLIVSDRKKEFDILKKEINAISNYPLNTFVCNPQDFQENKDNIIIQARKTGFPIRGEQYFYEAQLFETFKIL